MKGAGKANESNDVYAAVVSPFAGLLTGEAVRDMGRLGGVGAEIRGVVVGGVAAATGVASSPPRAISR